MADTPTAGEQASAREQLRQALTDFGLASLTDWAYGQVAAGKTAPEILQGLRQTPEYKQRFAVNDKRRAAGKDPLPESYIINYEQGAREVMRAAGIPAALYDHPDDFADGLVNEVGLPELQTRIAKGYSRVADNPVVRQQFRDWFGVDGDTALAMYFADSTKALPYLLQQVDAGTLGGQAERFGIHLSKDRALALAQSGINVDAAPAQFGQLARLKPLFNETITETVDLSAEQQGVDAVFNQTDAMGQLEQRAQDRAAQAGGGGAVRLGQSGSGLGSNPV